MFPFIEPAVDSFFPNRYSSLHDQTVPVSPSLPKVYISGLLVFCLSLDTASSQEATSVIVPLLTVSKNASDDAAEIQETFTRDDAETAITDRLIAADVPVVIPDDLLVQSSSDQNETIIKSATNDSQQLPLSYSATAASATEITETGYFVLSMLNTTTNDSADVIATYEPPVEKEESARENTSRVENTSGNLYLSSFYYSRSRQCRNKKVIQANATSTN